MRNNIDKRISYGTKTIKDPTYDVYKKGGPVQLELPLDNPNDNIINFPIKPDTPIFNWYKANKKEFKKVASIDDIGPFLTKFVSEKELRKMNESEVESLLPDLLDRGLLWTTL